MFPVAMASPVGAGFAPALCHQQPTLLDLSLSDFCREFRANGFSCVLRLRALPGFSWTAHFTDARLRGRFAADFALKLFHIFGTDGLGFHFIIIVVISSFL